MSVSEWLTTRERTNMDNRMTDAEIAAQWAAQALTEGRYDLGRALANIAAQAAQTGARLVPMIGQTRNETPDRAQDAATELLTLPQHAPGPY